MFYCAFIRHFSNYFIIAIIANCKVLGPDDYCSDVGN